MAFSLCLCPPLHCLVRMVCLTHDHKQMLGASLPQSITTINLVPSFDTILSPFFKKSNHDLLIRCPEFLIHLGFFSNVGKGKSLSHSFFTENLTQHILACAEQWGRKLLDGSCCGFKGACPTRRFYKRESRKNMQIKLKTSL